MNTISLNTAVLVAIQSLVASQKSFSAHDVTKKIRELSNSGQFSIANADTQELDGVEYEVIEHSDVRSIVEELWVSGVCEYSGLARKFNGQFYEYFLEDKPRVSVTAGVAQPSPVSPAGYSPKIPVIQKIEDYIHNRGSASLKQVQSRLKGLNLTCQDIGKIIQSSDKLALKSHAIYSLSEVVPVGK